MTSPPELGGGRQEPLDERPHDHPADGEAHLLELLREISPCVLQTPHHRLDTHGAEKGRDSEADRISGYGSDDGNALQRLLNRL